MEFFLVEYLNISPSGLSEDENGEIVDSTPYVGKCGEVTEIDDTSRDCENPTGYEPIYYLVHFEDALKSEKLWIPARTFCGLKDDREVWSNHLSMMGVPKSFFKEKLLLWIQKYGNSCQNEGLLEEYPEQQVDAIKQRAEMFAKIQKLIEMM